MHFSIFASIGEGNVGDELVLGGVITELRELDQTAKITVFSHNPGETRKMHPDVNVERIIPTGVRTFLRWVLTPGFWRGIRTLLRSDYVVIGGGGLLYDREVGRGVNPILVWFLRCFFFRLLGRKIILYGIGIGPVESNNSHFLVREICRMASLVIVRDQLSRRLLRELRLEVEVDVKLGEDPAWSAYKGEIAVAAKKAAEGVTGSKPATTTVGVALRTWYPLGSKAEKELLQELAGFLDELSDQEAVRLKFLPFATKAPDDRPFLTKLRELTKVREVEFLPDYLAPAAMINQLQDCDAVLAMRLHAILLSLRLGKPLLPISYSSKTDALLAQARCAPLAVPIASLTKSALKNSWQQLQKIKFSPQQGSGINRQLLQEFMAA